jgi:hypothetical protein
MGISIGGSHVDNIRECSPPIHHKGIALALNGNKFPSNLQEKLCRSNASIDLFDYHESSGTFILGIHIPHSMTSWGYLASARLRTHSRSSNSLPQYEVSPLVVDLPKTEFSSLQITPNSNIITTTYGGGKVQFVMTLIPY